MGKRSTVSPVPVLLVGFGDTASGFSRVVHSIAEGLPGPYEIHHLAVNVRQRISGSYPWVLHPSDVRGDSLGVIKLRQLIDRIQPRLVWVLNDFWYLAGYYPVLRDCADRCKSIAYMPLDGKILDARMLGALQFYDVVVLYNEFSRRELQRSLERVARDDPEFVAPSLAVIPHGVDQLRFRPLSSSGESDGAARLRRQRARDLLHGTGCGFRDGFVVLNANQNAARKRLDLTVEGFARFARDKPSDVKLHLHSMPDPGDRKRNGLDVRRRAMDLGIADRLVLTEPPVSDERLNLIYNACDVGINTSWGEGWGLVSFEHAATRAAQIVPDHTACSELWPGAAELLPTQEGDRSGPEVLEKRFTTPALVADALEKLYGDRDYRDRMSERAYQLATRTSYQWREIGRQWGELFQVVLGRPAPV